MTGPAVSVPLASTTTVRAATIGDSTEIYRVHQASVRGLCSKSYSAQHIDLWFDGRTPDIYLSVFRDGRIFVAEQAHRVVGFVGAKPGEVISLFVSPEVAGQGVGRQLFELGLACAREGFEGPITVVATLNAEAFYAQYGFEPVEAGTLVRGQIRLEYPVVKMMLKAGRDAVGAKALSTVEAAILAEPRRPS